MIKSLKKVSIKDLAGLVSRQLGLHGLEAVLTGGACVSIYSRNKYQSLDLDFVTYAAQDHPKTVLLAMKEIGFRRADEGFFEHPTCPYIIEFLPPPLAVGREPVKQIDSLKTSLGTFKLLSPTDCVKDRLAAFFHWDDQQSLEQALLVARKKKVDLKELKRWSKNENHLTKFTIFLNKANEQ